MKTLAIVLSILICLAVSAMAAPPRSDLAQRDDGGKIKRSTAAKHEFRRQNPCPATGQITGACPGYAIDHVQALKHGGPDHPDNMQWLTVDEHKEKTRRE